MAMLIGYSHHKNKHSTKTFTSEVHLQALKLVLTSEGTYGAFPLHGTARYGSVRFTFGGFSTGYCTWYLVPQPRFQASHTVTKT